MTNVLRKCYTLGTEMYTRPRLLRQGAGVEQNKAGAYPLQSFSKVNRRVNRPFWAHVKLPPPSVLAFGKNMLPMAADRPHLDTKTR